MKSPWYLRVVCAVVGHRWVGPRYSGEATIPMLALCSRCGQRQRLIR